MIKICHNDISYTEAMKAHSRVLTLAECFAEFIETELISDSSCEKCERKTEREKSMKLFRLPEILVIF